MKTSSFTDFFLGLAVGTLFMLIILVNVFSNSIDKTEKQCLQVVEKTYLTACFTHIKSGEQLTAEQKQQCLEAGDAYMQYFRSLYGIERN